MVLDFDNWILFALFFLNAEFLHFWHWIRGCQQAATYLTVKYLLSLKLIHKIFHSMDFGFWDTGSSINTSNTLALGSQCLIAGYVLIMSVSGAFIIT